VKRFLILSILAIIALGGWWIWENPHQLQETLKEYVDVGEVLTLEARYTPEQLMEKHRKTLISDAQHSYQEPILRFYPHLLFETKYAQGDRKTREGNLLWSLTDGEIILDTETWEKTHGYEDAIQAGANRGDFRILFVLARRGGSLTREELQQELHVESDALISLISSALEKHLIIQIGNQYQLHFQNPKILIIPETKIKQTLVTKPINSLQKAPKRYTRSQVEKIAYAAFGPAFTIRNVHEVLIPVYSIAVQNPDGSTHHSYWNALTGQPFIAQLIPTY
jgi:hypothetical protein